MTQKLAEKNKAIVLAVFDTRPMFGLRFAPEACTTGELL